jgi:hypothetical protein
MSSEKLDRLYAEMMAEAQAEERHRIEADKCLARVQKLSDEIKAECERREKERAANEFTETLRDIALSALAPLERV